MASAGALAPGLEKGSMSICCGPKVHHRRRVLPSCISTSITGRSGLRVRILIRSSSLGSPAPRAPRALVREHAVLNQMSGATAAASTVDFPAVSVQLVRNSEQEHGRPAEQPAVAGTGAKQTSIEKTHETFNVR